MKCLALNGRIWDLPEGSNLESLEIQIKGAIDSGNETHVHVMSPESGYEEPFLLAINPSTISSWAVFEDPYGGKGKLYRREIANPDLILTILGEVAESSGLELGITLSVGGTTITGVLVSEETYIEGIRDALGASGEAGKALGDGLAKGFAEFRERRESDDSEPIVYLHLKRARLVTQGDRSTDVWWRVRAVEVDAWTFGEMTVS